MRYIREIYAAAAVARTPVVSFEFFTPKTEEGERSLFERTLPALARCQPAYCSVTYGAGGTTREKTLGMVDRIQRQFGVPGMAHLTCVGSSREQIVALLAEAKALGIRNILALRGDPPGGGVAFTKPEGGFQFAHELVTLTRQVGGCGIGVAGFPEGHLECREGRFVDWERLRAKIECGADYVLTQLFFDNRHFYEFRDHLAGKLRVTVPLVPGVIPILSAAQIKKFTAVCGASLPPDLVTRLEALGEDEEASLQFGIDFATAQCTELLREGVPGIHFYTLNKARSTTAILRNLGLAV